MNVGEVIRVLERIAPPQYAEPWDNIGLLIGASDWNVGSILLTIDLTPDVLAEARSGRTSMIIAYHPPIFDSLDAVTDATVSQRIVLDAARNGIAVYSPHTALDAAPGGVNDWLAQGLGDADIRALRNHNALPSSEQLKIVTFCPGDAVDAVRNALASVGAGQIGQYSLCSFELAGHGTFLGGLGTNPTIGEAGQLERVDEIRLEMVCSHSSLPLAVTMLRQAHPYEEPPIEIYELKPRPMRDTGAGRRVTFDQPVVLGDLASRVKRRLVVEHLFVAEADGRHAYHRVGICVGAGGSMLSDAIEQDCDAFITGELRHHSVLESLSRGCTVILAGHTNTERGYLPVLRDKLADALPQASISISKCDRDPLRMI